MNPELTMLYVPSRSIGYGRLGVDLTAALTARGVDIYDHQNQEGVEVPPDRRAKDTNVVCWVTVPTHAQGWVDTQHAAIFTMFESTQLPEAFRETLHDFDTVMVPSFQNVELFSRFHDNVKLVLLGVDPNQWNYVPRTPPADKFRFLIGGSGARKGVDLAFKAFVTVFGRGMEYPGNGPIPELVMKSPKGGDFYHPRVQIVSGKLSDEDEVALYATAHCYVQPSRGEGFGLQPLQAIAQGCPTILTNAHGQESFAHLGWGISTAPSKADYFIYGDPGEWWEPDLGELCELMYEAYHSYDAFEEKAKHSAVEVAEKWTWANTADQFVAAIGEDLLTTPFTPGSWHDIERRLYPVVVDRNHQASIAGVEKSWIAGRTYWEPADVKRILFEGGYLDPSCLNDEHHGLSPQQVARLDLYRSEHDYCPTCRQRMNSAPTKADDLLAASP